MAATCAGVWCIMSQPSCRRQQLLLAARGQVKSCSNSRHLGASLAATRQNRGPALAHTTRIPIHECPCPESVYCSFFQAARGHIMCCNNPRVSCNPSWTLLPHATAVQWPACNGWKTEDRVDKTTITNTPGMACTHLAHPSAHTPCRQTLCRRN
jgi:hypothetical protein